MSLADDLQKLHTLHEQGALNDEEFARAKKRLLDDTGQAKTRSETPRATATALKQLRRSNTDRWIGGVSGGLADVSGIPSWAWRILFVLTALLHGVGVVIYLLMWIFVPLQSATPQLPAPARTDSST